MFKSLHSNYFIDLEKHKDLRKKPVQRVILFTNARNEKNIQEWATHHLLLGFSLIYIFDHKSTIPIQNEFNQNPAFNNRVIVERCEMDGAIKISLMKRASIIAGSLYADWMLYLDADEFLVLNSFVGVKQMLSRFHFADSVAINWLMFGSNNHIEEPDGLIVENYTRSDQLLNPHVKSFVRPSQVTTATNPHYFNIVHPRRMFSISNQPMNPASYSFCDWSIEYGNSPAYIAHYLYQSEETYKNRKLLLPRDDNGGQREKDNNIHACHNDYENESVKNKYAVHIRSFLDKWH
jgi:hypothetical protein